MRAGLQNYEKQHDWKAAGITASNLSELELTLGEIAGAVRDAEQSVTYADRSGDAFWKAVARAAHADSLHQAGRRLEAETRFREAEQMQAARSDLPLLYSLRGFSYGDLLLATPERSAWQTILSLNSRLSSINSAVFNCRSVSQRAVQTLKIAERNNWLLDIALDHLTLGRAALYEAILGSPNSDLRIAISEIDAAIAGLHRAAHNEFIVRGLLTQAWLRFRTGARSGTESAQEDLDEAWEIAERGPMKLHLADIHLTRARLFGGRKAGTGNRKEETAYPWESPASDLAAAEKLIKDCGYHRRDEELADAKRAILGS
jgi:tetratricopeptide (TPR) repeat protein